MLQHPLEQNISRQSMFWFNISILFFSTTMFLNLGLLNYYAEHKWGKDLIYLLWVGNFYLLYILNSVSLLLDNKEIKVDNA